MKKTGIAPRFLVLTLSRRMCEKNVIQGKEKLAKRAKRKFLSYPLIKHLANLESPLKEKYLSSLGCSAKIRTNDGKMVSRYCKRPWCNVCNPIRTAIRINNYREQLEGLPDLTLTTLTAPNCSADEILSSVQLFRKVFRQFRNTYKKRTGKVFRGVYNFECTYNHKVKNYHPHIHIIHEGIETWQVPTSQYNRDTGKYENVDKDTNALIEYWLEHNPQSNFLAQDTRPCYDLIEGFKYQALSIFKIKINGKKQPFVPVVELDVIYQCLFGVRCFQSFGIRKAAKEEDQQFDELTSYEISKPDGVYLWNCHDWHHVHHSDIVLSEFVPNQKIVNHYEKIERNIFYKPSLHLSKRVRAVSRAEVPQSYSAALLRVSHAIREKSKTETDKH